MGEGVSNLEDKNEECHVYVLVQDSSPRCSQRSHHSLQECEVPEENPSWEGSVTDS